MDQRYSLAHFRIVIFSDRLQYIKTPRLTKQIPTVKHTQIRSTQTVHCNVIWRFLTQIPADTKCLPRLEALKLYIAASPVEHLICQAVPHHLLYGRGEEVVPLLGDVVRLPTGGRWRRARTDVSHFTSFIP